MTWKELKKKYRGYGFIAYGKSLDNMTNMIPYSFTSNISNWDKAIVLDYIVHEYGKPHKITGFNFKTMKPTKPEYEIGMVYAYVKEGDE